MMIIGEGHGGTESNNKLFNSLVKSVSVVVVPECSISAKCSKCRVQWRMAVVTVSPLVHCSGLRRVDTEDTATAAVAPPTLQDTRQLPHTTSPLLQCFNIASCDVIISSDQPPHLPCVTLNSGENVIFNTV